MQQTTLISILLLLATLPLALPSPNHFKKIYAFGDSFTDTGNTRSSSGPQSFTHVSNLPYGTTFFHRPTNRYSDGRLVIDFLTTKLSLPFLPPYGNKNSNFTHGVNFAVAGSTAIDYEFFVRNNITLDITPQSLSTQLKWFDEHLTKKGCANKGSIECSEVFKDALFWVGEIGVNDYAYSTIASSSVSAEDIRDLAVKNVDTFLQSLLERGAKHVVVQGLPLAGCLPLTLLLADSTDRDELNCSATQNKVSSAHNALLRSKLRSLRSKYPSAFISYADYSGACRAIMQNLARYGFAEPFLVCCGSGGGPLNFDPLNTCGSPDVLKACESPEKFVNWDGVHFTEAMYKTVADLFFRSGFMKPAFGALLNSEMNA